MQSLRILNFFTAEVYFCCISQTALGFGILNRGEFSDLEQFTFEGFEAVRL